MDSSQSCVQIAPSDGQITGHVGHAPEFLTSANPFLSDLGTNPFYDNTSTNENIVQLAQTSGTVGHGLDLLTGEFQYSPSVIQPELTKTAKGAEVSDALDFLDNLSMDHSSLLPDSKGSSSPRKVALTPTQEKGASNTYSGVDHYIKCFRALSGLNKVVLLTIYLLFLYYNNAYANLYFI